MDTHLFVVAIALLALVLTLWITFLMRDRALRPERRRLLWVLLAAGALALGMVGVMLGAA